jgi:hypothetical protein
MNDSIVRVLKPARSCSFGGSVPVAAARQTANLVLEAAPISRGKLGGYERWVRIGWAGAKAVCQFFARLVYGRNVEVSEA